MVLNATFNNISNISWRSVENIEYTSTFHISVIIRYVQSNMHSTVTVWRKRIDENIKQLSAYLRSVDTICQLHFLVIQILLLLRVIYWKKNGGSFVMLQCFCNTYQLSS